MNSVATRVLGDALNANLTQRLRRFVSWMRCSIRRIFVESHVAVRCDGVTLYLVGGAASYSVIPKITHQFSSRDAVLAVPLLVILSADSGRAGLSARCAHVFVCDLGLGVIGVLYAIR